MANPDGRGAAAPKISLSLNPSSSSSSSSSSKLAAAAAAAAAQKKRAAAGISTPQKRPHSSLLGPSADDEPEENDGAGHFREQQITSFDAFSAGRAREDERVIAPLQNRDWRAKRQKSGIPGASTDGGGRDVPASYQEELEGSGLKYGLTQAGGKKVPGAADDDNSTTATPRPQSAPRAEKDDEVQQQPAQNGDSKAEAEKPADADEEAILALTGKAPAAGETLVIRADPEEEAFRDAYAEAPRAATLAEYEATPVEGFGAAILRGYLKPGETLQSRVDRYNAGRSKTTSATSRHANAGKDTSEERRPALLGIGAKAVQGAEMAELGIWGKSRGKKGRQQQDTDYAPLARRNVETGEVISEEEYQKRQDNNRMVAEGGEEQEDRDGGDGGGGRRRNGHGDRKPERRVDEREDRDRDRDRRRAERDDGRDRHRGRRDRSDSPHHKSKRRRRDEEGDDEDDEEYYRRKEKERRRRERDGGGGGGGDYYDSSSSRRDRDRDRDRDRRDDRKHRDRRDQRR